MLIQTTPQGLLVTGLEPFTLAQTLDCGQCFRFSQAGVWWHGVAGSHPVTLRQTSDGLLFQHTTPEEFESFWRIYFDLDRDYGAIRGKYDNALLCECARFASGIRILKQDSFEALISFIISQNNNVPRIKGIIDRLCHAFGEPVGGDYGFPLPETLAALSEEQLAPLRSGWRAGYILDAARRVSSGEVDLKAVSGMPLEEARKALQVIRGVGPKVAECVLLYGMGRLEAFPLDVWMKRAMKELFPDCTPQSFGIYAGIAQQYIFHYCRCHPESCRIRA